MPHQHRTRRMRDQEWLFDKVIEANGPDYFWPMTIELLNGVGMDLYKDVMLDLKPRIKKAVDIPRELARVAARREAMAREAEAAGHLVTARDNYFSAAACYCQASGPIHEDDNPDNIHYDKKKIECYDSFIKYAQRPIERVEIPFEGTSLPGFLHLPYRGARDVPCVIYLGGMDMFKEMLVTVYGDKLLERGFAVFAFDGPGQNEAALRKIRCTTDNFVAAGKAAVDYVVSRPEIDSGKLGITGVSMGSFWSLQIAAHEPRLKAASGYFVCHEPGMHTIFDVACPVFKDRYMWMAGYENEAEFDEFARTLSINEVVSNIQCPVMIVAGEDDELSPIENSYRIYDAIRSPKKIVVHEGEHHGVADVGGVKTRIADWMLDVFARKPIKSERIYVRKSGEEEVSS